MCQVFGENSKVGVAAVLLQDIIFLYIDCGFQKIQWEPCYIECIQ